MKKLRWFAKRAVKERLLAPHIESLEDRNAPGDMLNLMHAGVALPLLQLFPEESEHSPDLSSKGSSRPNECSICWK